MRPFSSAVSNSLQSSRIVRLALLAVAGWIGLSGSVHAQSQVVPGGTRGPLGGFEPAGRYPDDNYYLGLRAFRDGDLESAARFFEVARRGSRLTVEGRWIDSIPATVMMGECAYRFGDLETADRSFREALASLSRQDDLLRRADWKSAFVSAPTPNPPQWLWPSARTVRLIPISDRIVFTGGRQVTEASLVRGGAIEPLNARPMDLMEVLRMTAWAGIRLRTLWGPLVTTVPQPAAALDRVRYPAELSHPAIKSVIGGVRGPLYHAVFRDAKAVEKVSEATGGGAHPLSAVAMWAALMGQTAGGEDPAASVAPALQMADAAAALGQTELIGPALAIAARGASAEASAAVAAKCAEISGATARRDALASAEAALAAAECRLAVGDAAAAGEALRRVTEVLPRRANWPRMKSRMAWIEARRLATVGGPGAVDKVRRSVDAIGGGGQKGGRGSGRGGGRRNAGATSSPRIRQMAAAATVIAGETGLKTAGELMRYYTGDSVPSVWRIDPVDALISTGIDRTPLHAAYLRLAAGVGVEREVVRAIDRAVRDAFNQTRPLGGRVLRVRQLSWSEDSQLGKPAEDFLSTHPPLRELRDAALNPAAVDPASLESAAWAVALSPSPVPATDRPVDPAAEDFFAGLPDSDGVLMFQPFGGAMLVVEYREGNYRMRSTPAAPIEKAAGRLLKAIGFGKPPLRPDDVDDPKELNEACRELGRLLLTGTGFVEDMPTRLHVIPGGSLWRVPLGAIILPDAGGEPEPESTVRLADRTSVIVHVRPSAVVTAPVEPRVPPRWAIAPGNLLASQRPEDAALLWEDVTAAAADPLVLSARPGPNPAPTPPTFAIGGTAPQLLVGGVVRPGGAMPMAATDPPRQTLGDWLGFPHAPPTRVVLAGVQPSSPMELFALLTTLHEAGVEDVFWSRWAVGGGSSAIVMQELVADDYSVPLEDSARRALAILRRQTLEAGGEPLLRRWPKDAPAVPADHPLFWSGYGVTAPVHQ